jgi:heterodisulfide reductase subunit A
MMKRGKDTTHLLPSILYPQLLGLSLGIDAESLGLGMNAALDLADSGFYVYLVEKSSCIGGRMAQLDKTFPTNDCSMCIMGPKLVECGRHLNIEIITYADIESIEGSPGNFKVKIRKRARSINTDLCTGCGICVENCPVTNQAVTANQP